AQLRLLRRRREPTRSGADRGCGAVRRRAGDRGLVAASSRRRAVGTAGEGVLSTLGSTLGGSAALAQDGERPMLARPYRFASDAALLLAWFLSAPTLVHQVAAQHQGAWLDSFDHDHSGANAT